MQTIFHSKFMKRIDIPELMDDPDSDPEKLIRTVRQFRLINLLLSRSRRLIKKYILPQMIPGRKEAYRFLDVGAGGCDIAIWFLSICKKRGISVKITCLDYDPRIIAYAEECTRDIPEIEVLGKSVFDLDDEKSFDFTFSNHFLHHFPNKQIVDILNILNRNTDKVVLMNDLLRSKRSYMAYRIFALLFLHNSFAAYDGSVSILRGFSIEDMTHILSQSNPSDPNEMVTLFPGRVIVLSRKPEQGHK